MSPERLEQRCAATARLKEIRKMLSLGGLLDDAVFHLMSNEASWLESELRRREEDA